LNQITVLLSSAILVLAAAPAACCTCSLHTDARHRSQRRTRSRLPRPGGRRSRTPRARTSPSRQAHTGRCGLTRGRSRRAGCAQRRGSYTSTAQHPTRHSQPCEAHTPHHAHTYPRPRRRPYPHGARRASVARRSTGRETGHARPHTGGSQGNTPLSDPHSRTGVREGNRRQTAAGQKSGPSQPPHDKMPTCGNYLCHRKSGPLAMKSSIIERTVRFGHRSEIERGWLVDGSVFLLWSHSTIAS